MIGPPLHHFPSLREVLGVIVGGPHAIPLGMGKLALNYVRTETVLV